MDPKLTGKIIFEKRKEKGLNQLQLAELLNVSNRTISKWEKGDGYPDITLLPDISQCLDISIDELLTGEPPKAEPVPDNKDNEKEDKNKSISKLLNDFKLCFIVSMFFAICGATLGGITELYSIWAFPILFYTHWEIMFAAVSLFAVIASVFVFVIGIFRLHIEYSKQEIISLAKNKALILFILLAIFPLTFMARVIDFSAIGAFMPVIMLITIIILIVLVILAYKRVNNDKNN